MNPKTPKTNYASLLNKKKVFPNKHAVAPYLLRKTTGTTILKKIGNSPDEMYNFLTSTTSRFAPKFLPPLDDCNIAYLNNVILGLQDCFSSSETCNVNLEMIDELSKDRARPWIESRPEVLKMLPPRYEKNDQGLKVIRLPSREFLFTIWKLKDPEGFTRFVDEGRKANKTRIKHRETCEIEIVNEFYEKALEYEVTTYDKGTMPASIFNTYKKMENKRKRNIDQGRDEHYDSSDSDEVYQPEDDEDDQDKPKPSQSYGLKTKLVEAETLLDTKSKMIKDLELSLQSSVYERVKHIVDPEERREAYDTRAEEMEEDFQKFNLKIPQYEEVFEN